MSWVVFSYSLPSTKSKSTHRVTLWRRLRRLGAVAPKSGVYLLPDRDECRESFQWLAQEVQQMKGEAVVMKVERFEGLRDSDLIQTFHHACKNEYEKVDAQLDKVEKAASQADSSKALKEAFKKLRNQVSEIVRADFFNSPYGNQVLNRLKRMEEKLVSSKPSAVRSLPSLSIASYKNKTWVTRPRPHVDRLGCAWLIRRFIDKNARIRYADVPKPGEVPFDMKGVLLGHYQDLCSFETLLAAFHLDEPTLRAIAEIIHEIDLRDSRYFRPETEGITAILKGWIQAGFSDMELEDHGTALFEGLYNAFKRTLR